jgi:hypothetical protein
LYANNADLEEDVATLIERLRKARGVSLKDVVSEALQEGLGHMTSPPPRRTPFRTASVDLGRCLVSNVDNVAEVLAVADSESFQ